MGYLVTESETDRELTISSTQVWSRGLTGGPKQTYRIYLHQVRASGKHNEHAQAGQYLIELA
eukprot:1195527-Prorocentrum_minimum.AAC.5